MVRNFPRLSRGKDGEERLAYTALAVARPPPSHTSGLQRRTNEPRFMIPELTPPRLTSPPLRENPIDHTSKGKHTVDHPSLVKIQNDTTLPATIAETIHAADPLRITGHRPYYPPDSTQHGPHVATEIYSPLHTIPSPTPQVSLHTPENDDNGHGTLLPNIEPPVTMSNAEASPILTTPLSHNPTPEAPPRETTLKTSTATRVALSSFYDPSGGLVASVLLPLSLSNAAFRNPSYSSRQLLAHSLENGTLQGKGEEMQRAGVYMKQD
ncbi:hypothetical protein EDB85DRAFT_1900532 [Lactarius pseudohatsudake]|nr:hypothetical protein EDB85DRAFT_1900532 [Lactarius pseudohatsudake]